MKQQIKGGKGDKLNPKDVDQNQLKMGIKIEMEHTKDPQLAKEIAIDHLAEDPTYYSKLKTAKLEHKMNKMNKNKIIKLITEIAMQEMARIPTLYQLVTIDDAELDNLIPLDLKNSGIVKNIIKYFKANNNKPASTVGVAQAFGYKAQQPVNTQFQRLKNAGVLKNLGLAFPKKEKGPLVGQGRVPAAPASNTSKENIAYLINKLKKGQDPHESYKQWFEDTYDHDKYQELTALIAQLNSTNLKDEYAQIKQKIRKFLENLGIEFQAQGRKPSALPDTQDLGNYTKDEEGNEIPLGENQPSKPSTRPSPGIKEPPSRTTTPIKRPNRRPLTPPDPTTMPTPKNEVVKIKPLDYTQAIASSAKDYANKSQNENHKMINKITDRYKKLK